MAYIPTNWVDNVTMMDDNALNKIENGIVTLDTQLADIDTQLADTDTQLADISKIFVNVINPPKPLDYARLDNITDDTEAINACISYVNSVGGGSVFIPVGVSYCASNIILKSNVSLVGYGTINFKTNHSCITTETPILTALSQTTGIVVGNNGNLINNTLNVGDFIRYKSTKRFTEEWDGGTAIRAYYVDGEIYKIKNATPTTVEFEGCANLAFDLLNADSVEAFTPNKNIMVKGITVSRTLAIAVESSGILIQYCDNVIIKDVKTENMNYSGIVIEKSMNVSCENITILGGTSDMGLDYGIVIYNGSKHVHLKNIHGSRCRHVISGGGNGYAISMLNIIDGVFASNSLSHSIDTHGNTMFYTITNCSVDLGFSISGIGHILSNLTSENGYFYLYEGGTDLLVKDIIFNSCTHIKSDEEVIRVTLKNISIKTKNLMYNLIVGNNITRDNFSLINTDLNNATNSETADATLPNDAISHVGFWLYEKCKLINCHVEGFAIAVYANGANCIIDNLEVVNCGWNTSLSVYDCALHISKNAEYGRFNNISIEFNKVGLSTSSRIVRLENMGTGSGKKISLTNIYNGINHTMVYYYGVDASVAFTEVFMQNVRVSSGVGGDAVNCTGKFIYNSVVADN